MKAAFAIALALTAGQAEALSCIRPDVARSFQQAAEAEESYVVVLGRFTFDAPVQTDQTQQMPARFDGQALGAEGFSPFGGFDLSLEFQCLGPWCGSLPQDDVQTLAFVERGPDGYRLSVGPCYGNVFPDPTREDIARVEACMRGGPCEGDTR